MYWVLANGQPDLSSTLTSINLAILCKASDVKIFGYESILKPLLKELCSFENNGIFIPSIGKNIKGTVHCVVADNLGAHSISGLVESFSGPYVCWFCLGQRSDFQLKEVQSAAFRRRTKEEHILHVKAVQGNPTLTH